MEMENEIKPTILMTGFGPFGIHNINASWEAVKRIPDLLKSSEKSSNINLIIEEIPVSYEQVELKVKELWNKYKPLIMIHVGVSHMAKCLTIECQASSKGYSKPDISEKCPNEKGIDHKTIKTNFNTEHLCKDINECEIDCKAAISNDAGRYLCEYIYYHSLSLGDPKVLFVHVPDFDVYTSEKTAQGLFRILVHMIECTMCKNCNEN